MSRWVARAWALPPVNRRSSERVPQEFKAGFAALALREDRKEADLVREALAEYLVSRRAG